MRIIQLAVIILSFCHSACCVSWYDFDKHYILISLAICKMQIVAGSVSGDIRTKHLRAMGLSDAQQFHKLDRCLRLLILKSCLYKKNIQFSNFYVQNQEADRQ